MQWLCGSRIIMRERWEGVPPLGGGGILLWFGQLQTLDREDEAMLKKAVLSALDRLMQWAMGHSASRRAGQPVRVRGAQGRRIENTSGTGSWWHIVAMTSHDNHYLTSGKIVTPEDIERKHRELDELSSQSKRARPHLMRNCLRPDPAKAR